MINPVDAFRAHLDVEVEQKLTKDETDFTIRETVVLVSMFCELLGGGDGLLARTIPRTKTEWLEDSLLVIVEARINV